MRLFLGTDNAAWLRLDGPPLMVSVNRLPSSPSWRPQVDWFLDSGGFTELQRHGSWRTSATQHAERVANAAALGRLVHASPQDWMCEPAIIDGGAWRHASFHGTGRSVLEHQHLTVQNFLDLIAIAPSLPWVPVLQGWDRDDYHRCADLYAASGVVLSAYPVVGVGSICRRQSTPEAVAILRELAARGLRLHGFGFKQAGIAAAWDVLASSDSMAWSFNARLEKGPSCGRPNGRGGTVKSCAHCRHYALAWYNRTIARVGAPIAERLF